jgi:H/ACA ribonucleoprotein complex subunit 4
MSAPASEAPGPAAPSAFPPALAVRLGEGGFVLVDKPRGPTSHQVTAWARDLLGLPRAGHAGTLDPHVSGLLWIGYGAALKLLPLLLEFPKRYVGVVALHAEVADADLDRVLAEFVGPIYQTPPVRSAVRRERRVRTIYRLEKLERDGPNVLVDVTADSGTYIRTLAVDLGEALGVGAHLAELRRVGTGPFKDTDAVTLQTLADAAARARAGDEAPLAALLHPIEEVWREFPRVLLKPGAIGAVAHGADLAAGGIRSVTRPFRKGQPVVLLGASGELVALGTALVDSEELPARRQGWVIDSTRVFVEAADYALTWTAGTRRRSSTAAPSSEGTEG